MSKNSYSASNPWKENLKHRLWAIAISLLFTFFEYIVAAAAVNSNDSSYHHRFVTQYLSITSISQNAAAVFMYMVLGLALGISSFSYLFNERETSFYHSQPIKRSKLYLINIINSILIVAIPAIIMSEIGALIVGTAHGERMALISGTFVNTLMQLVFFIGSYMVAMIAAQLTGNMGTAIAGTLVFIGYGPAIFLIHNALMDFFTTAFNNYLVTSVDEAFRFSPALFGFAYWSETLINGHGYAHYIIASIIVSIILFCLGYFLYQKRPSEAAGHAMAYKVTKGPIKVLITIPVGLLFGLVFGSSFSDINGIGKGWAYFGITVGFLLSYAIMEIVYNSDFKKLFSHKITLIISLAVTYLIFGIFVFDLFGYDTYIPTENKIKSASIVTDKLEFEYNKAAIGDEDGDLDGFNVGAYNNSLDSLKYAKAALDTTEYSDTADIREIAKICVNNTVATKAVDYFISDYPTTTVYIKWNLTDGRSVYRKYIANSAEIEKYCEKLYNSRDYLTQKYSIMTDDPSDVYRVSYCDGYISYKLDKLSDSDLKRLIDTYKSELAAMSYSDKEKARYAGILQFRTKEAGEKYRRYSFDDDSHAVFNVYPLYRNMTETLGILSEFGYKTSVIDPDTVKAISVNRVSTDSDASTKSAYTSDVGYTSDEGITITDAKQIKEILDHSDPYALAINSIYDSSYDVTIYYKSGDTDTIFLIAGEVPSFLKE